MVEYRTETTADQPETTIAPELKDLIGQSEFAYCIEQVIFTTDFGTTVRKHLPPDRATAYQPTHDYGVAVGKTLFAMNDSEARCTIIFDARLFTAETHWIDQDYFVLHELAHVKNGIQRFQHYGTLEPLDFGTRYGYLFENAWGVWEEFRAERVAATEISEIIKESNPEAEFGFRCTETHGEEVLAKLEGFGGVLRSTFLRLQFGAMDLESFVREVTGRIASIAILLAYVFSLRGLLKGVDSRIKSIESDHEFRRFFITGWEIMEPNLFEYFGSRDAFRLRLVEEIARGYEAILNSCGLRMTDTPRGLYMEASRV